MVSHKIVVTAARCIKSPHEKAREVDSLTIYLGKSDLNSLNERGYITTGVQSISVHSDWGLHEGSYDADIAALVLLKTIIPRRFIMPICIWTSTKSFADLIGSKGTITGWGYNEKRVVSNEAPKWTEVEIVAQDTCLRSKRNFLKLTSNRTFCANGGSIATGPCNGDGGK